MENGTNPHGVLGESPGSPDVARKRGRKRDWGRAFLDAFRQIGVVTPAAAAAGVSRHAVRKRCLRDPAFARKYAEALEESTERLESLAFARAASQKDPSDLLLIFLLKARRPEMYREQRLLQHVGPGGGPVSVEVGIKPEDLERAREAYRLKVAREVRQVAGAGAIVPIVPSESSEGGGGK